MFENIKKHLVHKEDPNEVRSRTVSAENIPTEAKARRTSSLRRLSEQWWRRLMEAVFNGGFSDQVARYSSNEQTSDYVWSTIGWSTWGVIFPILSIAATKVSGIEAAGRFALAFVVSNLLLFVGNYGVRTYQVSDIDEEHSFSDYNIQRIMTCIIMIFAGWLWVKVRGYDHEMAMICVGVFGFRVVDAYADVYEGRLQQVNKLYLAGISQTIRSVAATLFFCIFIFISKSIVVAGIAMAIASLITLFVVTIPLTLFETRKSRKASPIEIKEIFVQCFPLFIALFLYNLLDSMPKFAMEGVLSYDNQLYFNVMYFPPHAILMLTGMIYKPQLLRMSELWADKDKRKRFDLIIYGMLAIIAVLTGLTALFMDYVGISLLSLMYGIDFEQFRYLVMLMVIVGGISGAIDFIYQVITVLRQQEHVTSLYLITFFVSLPLSWAFIHLLGLEGAVYDSMVIMGLLFALLMYEYYAIRRRLS